MIPVLLGASGDSRIIAFGIPTTSIAHSGWCNQHPVSWTNEERLDSLLCPGSAQAYYPFNMGPKRDLSDVLAL